MKPSIKIRKVITASFFTAILGGASLVSKAAAGHGREGGDRNSAATAEVKYIPGAQGQGIYNVRYNNAAGNRFTVRITDVDGNQLYQDVYTDKKFDKNFRLADPDDYSKLIFVIHNLADNSNQRFEVVASSHLVEDVDVREVR
jgi:hypothetical protein